MSARQVRSHAAILRGIAVLLGLCELASHASVTPGLLRGGIAPLLALPFFAPSLIGSFASQVLLRPRRGELIATAVAAGLLAAPIYRYDAGPHPAVSSAACALGLGAIASLIAAAIRAHGSERYAVLEVLLPALILPGFVILAHPMIYLTAALWPTTYDHRMYIADAAFGAPLSFTVGRFTASVPLLNDLCLGVYVCLPLALMLVHALRRRAGVRSSDALVAFVAVTIVGYAGYHLVPVTGPIYAFPGSFPLAPPDPAMLDASRTVAAAMPRNCMPSLHSAWALLVWWNARPLAGWMRALAAAFLTITLLATVGLGFHYVVDVVAAFPLTLAAQAWATRVTNERLRRSAIAAGLAMTLAWIAMVTWSDVFLATPAPALWLLASAVVAVSSLLERRIHAARLEQDLPVRARPPVLSWPARGAALALVLIGIADLLHHRMLSNALVLVVGDAPAMRAGLSVLALAGIAIGAGASVRLLAVFTNPLRVAAAAAAGAAAFRVISVQALPWIESRPGAGDVFRLGTVALLLLPGAMASGLLVAAVARHLCIEEERPGRATGLAIALAMLGAGIGALATAYLVRPSLVFHHIALSLYAATTVIAAAAAIARKPAPPAQCERKALAAAHASVALGAIWGGVLIATLAQLLTSALGDTVYSRDQVAASVLAGIGAGALIAWHLLIERDARRLLAWSAAALLAVTTLQLPLWSGMPGYFASFEGYVDRYQMMTVFRQREFVRLFAVLFFALPAMLGAGALLTSAAVVAAEDRRRAADGFSRTAPLALTGGILGTLAARFMLLPAFGARAMLAAVIAAGLALALIPLRRLDGGARRSCAAVLALTAILLPFLASRFDADRLASRSGLTFRPELPGEVVDRAYGGSGLLTVHRPAGGNGKVLCVNGLVEAESRDGLVPSAREMAGLLRAAGRERALVIGLGDGRSARILEDAGFAHVIVAEPDAAIVAMAGTHFTSIGDATPRSSGISLRTTDGRSVLQASESSFDLITIEKPQVSVPETASLCTRDFYRIVAAHLTAGGVMQQSFALERLSAVGLTSVLASSRQAFDGVRLYFLGTHATLVACRGDCAARPDSPDGDAVLAGLADRMTEDAPSADEGGWLEPADIDRLLSAMAGRLGVAPEALASTDRDLFLTYQAPYSFVTAGKAPESLRLLAQYARKSASAQSPAATF